MNRSRWPLYAVLTVAVFILTGALLWRAIVPEDLRNPGPFDVRTLGLGTKATIVATVGTDCDSCMESIDFYTQLMALEEMNGTERRLVVVSTNGVGPVASVFEPRGFQPHHLTSGPGMGQSVPGARDAGVLLLLDAEGVQKGRWVGPLTSEQRQEIIDAVRAS